jgi:hypothetical protein
MIERGCASCSRVDAWSAQGRPVDLTPLHETFPAKLLCRAHLIGEAEAIGPALLLGTPAAVPVELELAMMAGAFDTDATNEVRASGPSVDMNALDRQLWVVVQQFCHDAKHLHARDGAREDDALHFLTGGVGSQLSLEPLAGKRSAEDVVVYGHGDVI